MALYPHRCFTSRHAYGAADNAVTRSIRKYHCGKYRIVALRVAGPALPHWCFIALSPSWALEVYFAAPPLRVKYFPFCVFQVMSWRTSVGSTVLECTRAVVIELFREVYPSQ